MADCCISGAVEWILKQGGEIPHPNPRKALGVALLFTSSALRDVILFRETWVPDVSGDSVEELVEELILAAEAYLGLVEE